LLVLDTVEGKKNLLRQIRATANATSEALLRELLFAPSAIEQLRASGAGGGCGGKAAR
jgi:hypothetical protein